MRKLHAFTFISLDGYYKDADNSTHWHQHGAEESAYSEQQLRTNNVLLFGRVTYEMMHSFWPTPHAAQLFPEVARGMNAAEKIVISNSLKKATWNNTTLMSGDIVSQLKKLKSTSGKNITILGSGSLLTLLTDAALIDTYEIMIDPVMLGSGTSVFHQIKQAHTLRLADSRVFASGTVLLTYHRTE